MTIRMRVLPRFPARISGINGISTYRDGPDLVIKSDYGSIVRIPAVENENTTFFKVWNSDDDSYAIMTFNDVIAALGSTTGLMAVSVYDPNGIHADVFNRGNHTGVQAISTVTGLQSALDTLTNTKLALAGGAMTGDIDMAGHNVINIREGVADFLTGLSTIRASSTTVTVGPGAIKGNGRYVKNTASMTKSLSTAWSAGGGAGAGALDAGAYAASETYFLHAIRKIADGSFDWLSSVSPTAPTVPAGYELVGRFWINLVSSSAILDYTQSGNKCELAAAVAESSLTSSFAKALVSLALAPKNISVDMLLDLSGAIGAAVNASVDAKLYDGYLPAGATSHAAHAGASSATNANSVNFFSTPKVRTNTSRQIYQSANFNVTTGSVILTSLGWEDWQLPRQGA
jgi:hypothetical protein